MTNYFLVANAERPTPALILEDNHNEGEVYCRRHAVEDTLNPLIDGCWWVEVPQELSDCITHGSCPYCHDEYADDLRESCERDQVARMEDSLEKMRDTARSMYGRNF